MSKFHSTDHQNHLNDTLFEACDPFDMGLIKETLKKGADIYCHNSYVLNEALSHGTLEDIQFLINEYHVDFKKAHPAFFVSISDINILIYLFDNGITPDINDHYILIMNARRGRLDIVQLLICNYNEDVNIVLDHPYVYDHVREWAEEYKKSNDLKNSIEKSLNESSIKKSYSFKKI